MLMILNMRLCACVCVGAVSGSCRWPKPCWPWRRQCCSSSGSDGLLFTLHSVHRVLIGGEDVWIEDIWASGSSSCDPPQRCTSPCSVCCRHGWRWASFPSSSPDRLVLDQQRPLPDRRSYMLTVRHALTRKLTRSKTMQWWRQELQVIHFGGKNVC